MGDGGRDVPADFIFAEQPGSIWAAWNTNRPAPGLLRGRVRGEGHADQFGIRIPAQDPRLRRTCTDFRELEFSRPLQEPVVGRQTNFVSVSDRMAQYQYRVQRGV